MGLESKNEENKTTTAKTVEVVTNEEMNNEINEIVGSTTSNQLADYEILNPELPMSMKIDTAVSVADTLKKVVESQGLVMTGLNKQKPDEKYVLKGGWEMLNTFMGIISVTKIIDEIRNDKGMVKGYKASCTLLKNPEYHNGEIVGGVVMGYAQASATKEGFQKDTASMMSMAQTRAYNKATRNCMGWIMQMAGYQGTPAEEMPNYKSNE